MARPRTDNKTFSKRQVNKILNFAILDMQLSYVLAFMGKEQIAESLSQTIVASIIGVMLGYFLKSFFETKEEEKIKLQREESGMNGLDFLDESEEM